MHLIRGWFEQTLPEHKKRIGPIALLHLDCDWYVSVGFCLSELYDQVVSCGFVVIDDYGHWLGCRRAVDEFLRQRTDNIVLTKIDHEAVYFRKPGANGREEENVDSRAVCNSQPGLWRSGESSCAGRKSP